MRIIIVKRDNFEDEDKTSVEGIQPSNVNTQSLNSAVCCESAKDRFARPDNDDDDDDDNNDTDNDNDDDDDDDDDDDEH